MKYKFYAALSFFLVIHSMELYAQSTYEFDLAGYHMVPAVHTTASGMIEVTIKADSLFVSGHFEELRGLYWSAYIHHGLHNETGNRLIRLTADVSDDHHSGTFSADNNAFRLSEAVRKALSEGKLYLVVSSDRYKQGEIRGQLPMI
jgi:hypothetical protein